MEKQNWNPGKQEGENNSQENIEETSVQQGWRASQADRRVQKTVGESLQAGGENSRLYDIPNLWTTTWEALLTAVTKFEEN